MKWLQQHLITFLVIAMLAALAYTGYTAAAHNATVAHLIIFLAAATFLLTYAFVRVLHTGWGKLASLLLGAVILLAGYKLLAYQSDEVALYNDAVTKLSSGDVENGLKQLDATVAAYRSECSRERLSALILPPARCDLAALALFQKGNALVQLKKTQEAAQAYEEGLRLNPGDTGDISPLLKKIAFDTRYNLELLQRSGQANGQGQGNKPADGKGPPKNDGRDPSENPANSHGHGNDDDI